MQSKKEGALIRIYGDIISQPTRAVVSFCSHAGIPYQFKKVVIGRGEPSSEQYTSVNPFQQVPTIEDLRTGFRLFESQAIMRYLCRSFPVSSHFYPEHDPYKVALVDQYLDSHLDGIRRGAHLVGVESYFSLRFSEEVMKHLRNPETMEFLWMRFHSNLDTLQHWLANQNRIKEAKLTNQFNWLAGVSEGPTIADFSAFSELYQHNFVPHRFKDIFSERPFLTQWFEKMHSLPAVKRVYDVLDKLIVRVKKLIETRPRI